VEHYKHTLKNGIRLVHINSDSPVAHFGLLVNTGSRDEKEQEHGMAHFIEHVIFKGTKKRRAYHILSRLDDVGGDLNAYTTKEETAFYASFLAGHYERSIELISDIVFNSVYPDNELAKERDVIIDEINSYKDSPSELIFDDFEELIYDGHPIGRNILGTPESIRGFGRKEIQEFLENNYHTDQMVLCSVGNIPFDKLVRFSEKYFGSIPENIRKDNRKAFSGYRPVNRTENLSTHQVHSILGNVAYNARNEKRLSLVLLNNLLGGQGLNSRLNLSLREKYGYAYNVESSFTPYFDTGVISIYFGTDRDKYEKSLKLIYRELNRLCSQKLGTLQLKRAKDQMIGQIAISAENKENLLFTLGKSYLLFDKYDDLPEVNRQINAISSSQLMEVANETLNPDQLSLLTYK
jgi:predicted Zn-dependent peptidase